MNEQEPVINPQIAEDFDKVASKSKEADKFLLADPIPSTLYGSVSNNEVHPDKRGDMPYEEYVGDKMQGPMLHAWRKAPGESIDKVTSAALKYKDRDNWVQAASLIDEGGKDGKAPQHKTHLRVTRNGESKVLESTNPLVANMVTQIALKQTNEKALERIQEGEARKAA